MKREIERKFLVHKDLLPPLPPGTGIRQAYLGQEPTVRIRREAPRMGEAPVRVVLAIKGPGLADREEYEYDIPPEDLAGLWGLAKGPVYKVRYHVPHGGYTWDLDQYHGGLTGLWTAEVELPSLDARVELPPWVGRELTGDKRYSNLSLGLLGLPEPLEAQP